MAHFHSYQNFVVETPCNLSVLTLYMQQEVSRKFQLHDNTMANIIILSQWNHTNFSPGSNMQFLSAAKIALIELLQQKAQVPIEELYLCNVNSCHILIKISQIVQQGFAVTANQVLHYLPQKRMKWAMYVCRENGTKQCAQRDVRYSQF